MSLARGLLEMWGVDPYSYSPPPFDPAAVDLRPGTPFGDLLEALIEFATEAGVFSKRSPGKKPLALKQEYEDYKLACTRWPEVKKLKPLSKLMKENSRKIFGGRYNYITADGIRKRIERWLTVLKIVKEHSSTPLKPSDPLEASPEVQAMVLTDMVKKAISAKRRGRRGKK
jgi:hypothetical protein